jgi:adenylate cyclase
MVDESVERRLAAVVILDVVGYSRLMEWDPTGTRERFRSIQTDLVQPILDDHRGRIVKTMGDAFLIEFGSVISAVTAAILLQRRMTEHQADRSAEDRIQFRIGINLGDLIIEGDDIHGDGVNVAARLEEMAEPGGIHISGTVFDQLKQKVEADYEFLGEQRVKNITEPVRVYRVLISPGAAGKVISKKRLFLNRRPIGVMVAAGILVALVAYSVWPGIQGVPPATTDFCKQKTALAVPDKPSIAVLPFDSLSGKARQESFGDSLAEDIITALAKVSDIFVISRNSSFTFKGKPVKVQQVAKELGVRYVLEGSVQQAGDRLRVYAKLIDAKSGNHLWADRYDRRIGDLFAIRDEITFNILTALQVKLTEGEQARLTRGRTTNLEAYLLFWNATEEFQRFNKEGNAKARALAKRIIKLDPEWSRGWLMLGWTYLQAIQYGADRTESIRFGSKYAEKAFQMDASNPDNNAIMAFVALARGDPAKAVELGRKAVALGPSSGDVHALLGLYLNAAGRPGEAIPIIRKAMRLSPYHPTFYSIQLGRAYRLTGRHTEAILEYKKLACRLPDSFFPYLGQALSYARLGREKEAGAAVAELLRVRPEYSLKLHKRRAIQKGTELARDLDNLRKAGVPE